MDLEASSTSSGGRGEDQPEGAFAQAVFSAKDSAHSLLLPGAAGPLSCPLLPKVFLPGLSQVPPPLP